MNFNLFQTEITSPNYPNDYENNLSCDWILIAPEGKSVELEAQSFDLEQPDDNYCYDYLQVCYVYDASTLRLCHVYVTYMLHLHYVYGVDIRQKSFLELDWWAES